MYADISLSSFPILPLLIHWHLHIRIQANPPDRKYHLHYSNLLSVLAMMKVFDQKNPHHNLTLGEHCIETYKKIKQYSDDKKWKSDPGFLSPVF